MLPSTQQRPSAFIVSLCRIFLSTLVCGILALTVHAASLVTRLAHGNSVSSQIPKPAIQKASQLSNSQVPSELILPSFHGGWGRSPHDLVLNGVRVVSGETESTASLTEVISYYKTQMSARGWLDVTEELHHFGERVTDGEVIETWEHNPGAMEQRQNMLESSLALQRGKWIMQIQAEPSKRQHSRTTIRITATETSQPSYITGASIRELNSLFQSGVTNRSWRIVERGANNRFETTITTTDESATRAFELEMAKLHSRGWRIAAEFPVHHQQPGSFVWLKRGSQYAALSVAKLGGQRAASIMFTEVTPQGTADPMPRIR